MSLSCNKKTTSLVKRILKKRDSTIPDKISAIELFGITQRLFTFIIEKRRKLKTSINVLTDKGLFNRLILKNYGEFCTLTNNLPTTSELLHTTSELYQVILRAQYHIPALVSLDEFRKILIKCGYMWKQSGRNIFVVYEKPSLRFERHDYLSSCKEYREEQKDIYYIDEIAIDMKCQCVDFKTSESLKNLVLQQRYIYAIGDGGITALEEVDEFSEAVFQNFIAKQLCRNITKPSVFIMKNLKHHNEKEIDAPTLFSSKQEMMDWLKYKNISFNPNVDSKYDLFSLIENCTDIDENTYKIDNIFKAYGHKVLRVPKTIEYTLPTSKFLDESDELFKQLADSGPMYFEDNVGSVVANDVMNHYIYSIWNDKINDYLSYTQREEAELLRLSVVVDNIASDHKCFERNFTFCDSNLPSCEDTDSD